MGFFDFLAPLMEVLSPVINAVGKVLEPVVNTVAKVLGPVIDKAITIVGGVAKALGIIKPEDNPIELGARTTVAEKKPEDFDDIQAYIDHVKEQHLPENFETASEKEKFGYKCFGVAILHKGTEEKMGIPIPVKFWIIPIKQGLDSDTALEVLGACKEKKVSSEDYTQYFDGKLEGAENARVDAQVVDVYKERFPEMDEKDIFNTIDSDKEKFQED